jgi:D-alanyl-D-alanine carboxypeptidase/D-alanyl-D-alanine-endopeptidase (penicillin-binding protein 4)
MKLIAVNTFLIFSLLSAGISTCLASPVTSKTNTHSEKISYLPESIATAIKKSGIPSQSVSISIDKISYKSQQGKLFSTVNLVDWQENSPMNPASTIKLLTSLAALEVLGPQYRWKTDLLTNGKIQNGLLKGDLLIRGSGDPKLIPEEINKILLNLQSLGVKRIDGQLILDRSAYEISVKETSFSSSSGNSLIMVFSPK